MIHEEIRRRLEESGSPFSANDNISHVLNWNDLQEMEQGVREAIDLLLERLVIDTTNDHNTKETSKRIAKMMMREIFSGRYIPAPEITEFPNAKNNHDLFTVGPISIKSSCSHHFVPVMGEAWIGVESDSKLLGLSKFSRLLRWVMSRPQIQEEATVQAADLFESILKPRGLAIAIRATHQCMTCRGVEESGATMVNSIFRGSLEISEEKRDRFFQLIKSQGF